MKIQAVGDAEIGRTDVQTVNFINGQCVPQFITFEVTHGQLAITGRGRRKLERVRTKQAPDLSGAGQSERSLAL